jgi:hypothetical protein
MLFGPLDISYCLVFYILSIGNLFICFGLFILSIINLQIFKKTTEISFLLILLFMLFFENRLLYSMCLNDTKTEIIETNDTLNNMQAILDRISKDQKKSVMELTSLNSGVDKVSSSVNATLDTNKTLLKYIKDHGELWKSKYPIIQINMDIMDKKLTTISNNTKPLQYRYNPNRINE